jgi:hypothetical protein
MAFQRITNGTGLYGDVDIDGMKQVCGSEILIERRRELTVSKPYFGHPYDDSR